MEIPTISLLIIVILLGILILIMVFLCVAAAQIGGNQYRPSTDKDFLKLKKMIVTIFPLLYALEKFGIEWGYYPNSLDEIYPDYLHSLDETYPGYLDSTFQIRLDTSGRNDRYLYHNEVGEWCYEPYRHQSHRVNHFVLSKKLGWDASLYYESTSRKWKYSDDSGSIVIEIELPHEP